jgi:hypothetical protein
MMHRRTRRDESEFPLDHPQQVADAGQFLDLHGRELDIEPTLGFDHQCDVGHRIPTGQIIACRLGRQLEAPILQHRTEYVGNLTRDHRMVRRVVGRHEHRAPDLAPRR